MNARALKTEKSRTKMKARRTRKRLKKAALDVFSEKSFDSATVEEITEKADVGKGTLYQHFEDKEEVVVTLVEEAAEHLIEYIRSFDSSPETLKDTLVHLINAHYRFYTDSKEEFILLFQGKMLLKLQSEAPEELQDPYLRYLKEIENQISTHISVRINSAKIRRFACVVAGFIFGFFSFAMIGMTYREIEESMKPLRQVFVKSLSNFTG